MVLPVDISRLLGLFIGSVVMDTALWKSGVRLWQNLQIQGAGTDLRGGEGGWC